MQEVIRVDKNRLLISSSSLLPLPSTDRAGQSFLTSLPLCYGIQSWQIVELGRVFGRAENVDVSLDLCFCKIFDIIIN